MLSEIVNISAFFCKIHKLPEIICHFREICSEKCSICWKMISKIRNFFFQNWKFRKFNKKLQTNAKIRIGAVQKKAQLVDLEECWKFKWVLVFSTIYLQRSASIQPRTSPKWKYEVSIIRVLLMLSPADERGAGGAAGTLGDRTTRRFSSSSRSTPWCGRRPRLL